MTTTTTDSVRVNLGCGRDVRDGWLNIDQFHSEGSDRPDLLCDFDTERVPLEDDSVDYVELIHVIEHLRNPLHVMEEVHRILKPNGMVHIACPHGSSDDAFEDPTHVRQYFPGSFLYFAQPTYWRADYGYRGDFDIERVELWVPKGVTMIHTIVSRNQVFEMKAWLKPVKPIREPNRDEMPRIKPVLRVADPGRELLRG